MLVRIACLGEPHQGGSSAWASGTLTPSPSALSLLTGLYQAWGIAVSLAADVIPCVRFNNFVRLENSTSSIAATLGMSGWLILAQQGLSPCKKRQASLDALTILGTAAGAFCQSAEPVFGQVMC